MRPWATVVVAVPLTSATPGDNPLVELAVNLNLRSQWDFPQDQDQDPMKAVAQMPMVSPPTDLASLSMTLSAVSPSWARTSLPEDTAAAAAQAVEEAIEVGAANVDQAST